MSKIEKDKFYVLKKPEHAILSIIFVGGVFPVDKEVHESLEKLKGISDILFIFDESTYSELSRIKKETFASLYGSKLWVETDNFLKGLINSFKYESEVFKSHRSILISDLWNIGGITDSQIKKLTEVCYSGITYPIIKIVRPTTEEYFKIYQGTSEEGIKRILDRLKELGKQVKEGENRYASYTSSSDIIHLRPDTTKTITEFLSSGQVKEYLESFTFPDFRYFLASIIKYLGLDVIDSNIYDVKI